MAETFPSLLRPIGSPPRFFPEHQSRSGGAALNGTEQTVASGAERWHCRGAWLARGKDAILQVEAFLAAMDGRSNEAIVPAFSGRLVNWPVDAFGRVLHPGFTRRDELDGTAYADPEIPTASAVNATLNANAALRAVQIAINMTQGSAIRAGQYFTIANRLYRIRTIVSVVGSVTTLTFRPTLRAAALSGAAVIFTRPVCTMKFASDDQGAEFDTFRGGAISLEFVESFT